jgi:two-component system sensor histidine kinase SenX3
VARTIGTVDGSLTTVAAALVGLLIGVAASVAFRLSERERTEVPESTPPGPVPAGVADVLAVLAGSAVVVDREDVVVQASPSAYAFGIVRGDRVIADEVLQAVHDVRRHGEIRDLELDLPRGPLASGTLTIGLRVAPLGSQLVLALIEDRTETRRVDAVRRDFVANVSHELKTPVGALALLAEAVQGAAGDPEAVARFAGRMQHEADRLSGLVQELIQLSRLQGDDPMRSARRVCVDRVVEEALDRCRLAAGQRRIELVQAPASGLEVVADESQLVTAVRNLVDNAVAYSPEGTKVSIGVRLADGLVEVSVADQGIGIPAADLERVFERFYRVDPARSRATGGTGLGLSIVKHVAANHGGEVTVWSVEGTGSTFTIRLPLAGRISPSSSGSVPEEAAS